MKRYIFFALATAVLLALLSGCGINPPDERKLTGLVPEEVLDYAYNGSVCRSNVIGLEISRRQTNEKDDYAECVIELEDESFHRTAYIAFTTKYYDKGGWQLEEWQEYAAEEFEPREAALEVVSDIILDQYGVLPECANLMNQEETADAGVVRVAQRYRIDQSFENVDVWGELNATATLESSEGYPKEFLWALDYDTDGMHYDWDIRGRWMIDMEYAYVNSLHKRITVTAMSGKNYFWDVDRHYYNVLSLDEDNEESRDTAQEYGDTVRDMYLQYDLRLGKKDGWNSGGMTTNYMRIKIYPREAICYQFLKNYIWNGREEIPEGYEGTFAVTREPL